MAFSYSMRLLVPTKLARPQPRTAWIRRDRLLDQIGATPTARLTLVVAPAGFGKSTLVADWLRHTQLRSAWLTLDEHDQDGLRFLAYVAGAVEHAAPGTLATTLQQLNAPEPPPLHIAVQALLIDLSALPDGLTLVLDDYHVITSEPVHQAVNYLLRHMPPTCHLVLISRADPPLSLARLRAERQLTELRAADLRFTEAEVEAFLARLNGQTPSDALVAALYQLTEGWAIAIQLAALAQRAGQAQDFAGIATRQIAEYLADEVFDQQPAAIRQALLALAVPERFCAELGGALLETSDELIGAEALLDQLVRSNLLLLPLDGEGRWYRFHHLFRDLLLRRLHLAAGPDGMRELQLRAARWLVAEGLVEEAIHHYLGAGDAAHLAQADTLLAGCLAEVEPLHNTRLLVNTLATQALLRQAQGRPAEALAALERAVTLAQGLTDAFLGAGPALRPLLHTLAEQGVAPTYLQRLLATRGAPAEANGSPLTAAHIPEPAELLTRRELEILALLAERWSDKEIAERLVIAPNTVRKHTSTIYDKLGVGSRREAVDAAHALGLLPDP